MMSDKEKRLLASLRQYLKHQCHTGYWDFSCVICLARCLAAVLEEKR